MRIIADTSVVVKWSVPEEKDSNLAKAVRAKSTRLLVPDSIIAEFGNVIWRKRKDGDITPQDAEKAIADFYRELSVGLMELFSSLNLFWRAFEMAKILKHPFYDCVFLALAERSGGVMVTTDEQFVRRVRRSEWGEFIRPLSDFS